MYVSFDSAITAHKHNAAYLSTYVFRLMDKLLWLLMLLLDCCMTTNEPLLCCVKQELRREVADLRRLEQQAQVEAQVLREELNQTGVQSAASAKALDERIKLLREVRLSI